MRTDKLYLDDIIKAAADIARFLGDTSETRFLGDDLLQSAVLQKLSVIGEAAARVSKPLTSRHPEVPWRDIVAFRNLAVHAYFAVDWQTVWITATQDVPLLVNQIVAIPASTDQIQGD
jgi:uncharacterized protein with HEPN domain